MGLISKLAFPVQAVAEATVKAIPGGEELRKAAQDIVIPPDDRIDQILEHLNFQRRPQLSAEFLVGELISIGTGTTKTSQEAIALLAADTTLINHKLGRRFQGWHIVWRDADSRIWEDVDDTSDRTTTLPLKCSANVNVRLLVF